MLQLTCSQCQATLPVPEDKIGKSHFVCPKCSFPLEVPDDWLKDPGAPVAKNGPAPVTASKLWEKQGEVEQTIVAGAPLPGFLSKPSPPALKPSPLKTNPASGPGPSIDIKKPGISTKQLVIGGVGAAAVGGAIGLVVVLGFFRSKPAPVTPEPSKDVAVKSVDTDGPAKDPKKDSAETVSVKPEDVVRALGDDDATTRVAAARTLTQMELTSPVSLSGLADKGVSARVQAIEVLATLGPEAAEEVPNLRELTVDNDPKIKKAASDALKRIQEASIKSLKDADSIKRANAVFALAGMGPDARKALPALIDVMKDDNAAVRAAVNDALVQIGPDAVSTMTQVLKDKNIEQRRSAIAILGGIGPLARDAVPALIAGIGDAKTSKETIAALARIGSAAVPGLVQALADDKTPAPQRNALTRALEAIGPDAALALKKAQDDKNQAVRKVAEQIQKKIAAKPQEEVKEPTGPAGEVFRQLRLRFHTWDGNKDGYLDKQELVKAFAGAGVNSKEGEKFLITLDRDGDDRISLAEYSRWAKDYSEQVAKTAKAQEEIARANLRLTEKGLSASMRLQANQLSADAWARYRGIQRAAGYQAHLEWLQRDIIRNTPGHKWRW